MNQPKQTPAWEAMDMDRRAQEVFRCAHAGMTMDQIADALGTARSNVQHIVNEYEIAIPSARQALWPKPDEPGIAIDLERWGRSAASQKYLNWKKATSGAREALKQWREEA